jgi:hypothetical protein
MTCPSIPADIFSGGARVRRAIPELPKASSFSDNAKVGFGAGSGGGFEL